MGHPLRWFLPGVIYETTIRTIQERFLLRPSAACREAVLGVLGRAQVLYPTVRLYAFVYLSNHAHLLVSADDGDRLASFLGFVNGNVARAVGRLHDWSGPVWGRRHRPIPILDDDAVVVRLRYLVAQGVKEGLVKSPLRWPGASSTPGLVGDMKLEGTWFDRDQITRARRRGLDDTPFARRYPITLTPIPAWAHLPAAELKAKHVALVREIEAEAHDSVVGEVALGTQSPHERPRDLNRSPAPLCHATSVTVRRRFLSALRAFVSRFRAAAASLRSAHERIAHSFPPGSFPPRVGHVRVPSSQAPPWLWPLVAA